MKDTVRMRRDSETKTTAVDCHSTGLNKQF